MPERSTVERVINRVGNRVISLFTGLLAAALIIYSGYVLYDTFYIQANAGNSWDLLDLRPQIIDDINDGSTPLASQLATINEDYRAWLTIYDTNIDYPVLQGPNDLYYASHDIYKNTSLTGALYLASGNSSDLSDNYNLIYGHHMDSNLLFGGLDNYTDTNYFNSHKTGILVSSVAVYDLDIFAVVSTDAYEDMIYNVGNRDLAELINYISANAVQYDAASAAGATQIVAFSTCESAATNGRLVVFARMTARNLDPDTPVTPDTPATPDNPETPDNPAAPDGPAPADGTPAVPVVPGGGDGTVIDDGTDTEPATERQEEDIIDNDPARAVINFFTPTGSFYGDKVWALVNLICLILTVYLLIPLTRFRGKINRIKTIKKLNEIERSRGSEAAAAAARAENGENDEDKYNVGRFRTKFIIGIVLEILLSAAAIIAFILTENMRLPMVLIDKWTPLMLIILIITWIADLILIRNRKKAEMRKKTRMREMHRHRFPDSPLSEKILYYPNKIE